MQQKTGFKPKYQHLSVKNYLQGLSKSCCACIAESVPTQVECLEGLVHLQEIDRKTRLGALLTGVKMHGTGVSIVGAHLRIRWVKRSADTDRESLGNFGPAFVSDLLVPGHIQAGQARVHLQEIDQNDTVTGGSANQTQNTWKLHVESSQQR